MKYRELGSSGLKISSIGFGCWAIGGETKGQSAGWGKTDDNESIAALRDAIDLGITFFDTADVYGLGYSEDIVARALGSRRREIILATKAGYEWDEEFHTRPNGSKSYILKACEASLRRLKTDYIDLYQIHCPDTKTPFAETMEALNELERSGKIRYVGISNFSVEQIKECLKFRRIHSLQTRYNMLERETEKELLPFCREQGIGVITYSSLAKGLLIGKFTTESKFEHGDHRPNDSLFKDGAFERNIAVVEKMKKIASRHGKSVTHLAIAWLLSNPAVSTALVGARSPSQIEQNAGGADCHLSDKEFKEIEKVLA